MRAAVRGGVQWLARFGSKRRSDGLEAYLGRRRIYILPTRQGLTFGTVLLAMLVGAMNYGNSLAFGLTFLLGSMSVVSILHTFRNLHGLRVMAGPCRPVFAGGTARFPVHMENPGIPRRSVTVNAAHADAVSADLPAGHGSIELAAPASRRGRMSPGRINVATSYPFGLFRAWAPVELAMDCLVYPCPEGTRPLPPAQVDASGERHAASTGTEDFAGLRRYMAGDPLRRVHWKMAARGQGMFTKQFAGGGTGRLWLDWKSTEGMRTEARLSQLCQWVLKAERLGLDYGLSLPPGASPALPSGSVEPGSGTVHRERCLAALAVFRGSDDGR